MNKLLPSFLAVITISTALAATPDPTAWYTPSAEDYKPPESYDALAEIVDARGNAHIVNFTLTVGEDGYITDNSLKASLADIKFSVNTALDLIDLTLRETGNNLLAIERLDAQFAALGKNLTKVFQIDGMKIKIGDKSYSLRIPAGSLRQAIQTGTSVEYHDEDGLFVTADDKTLMDVTSGGIRMIGWKSVPGAAPSLAQTVNGEIKWQPVKNLTSVFQTKVDNSSIVTNTSGEVLIKGWTGEHCQASLSSMLTDETDTDRHHHFILCRAGSGDKADMHYLPIGDVLPTNFITQVKVDKQSIVKSEGNLAINGWNAGIDAPGAVNSSTLGAILSSDENSNIHLLARAPGGSVSYVSPGEIEIPGADGTTIVNNDGVLSIPGFETAEGKILGRKDNALVWMEPDLASPIEAGSGISITSNDTARIVSHNLIAGAGISLTPAENGNGVTVARATPVNGTVIDPRAQEITFLTELWYDSESHEIKAKRMTAKVMFIGDIPEAEEFIAVRCTPHSAEHSSDEE